MNRLQSIRNTKRPHSKSKKKNTGQDGTKDLLKQTRINTKHNSEYRKCIIEFKEIERIKELQEGEMDEMEIDYSQIISEEIIDEDKDVEIMDESEMHADSPNEAPAAEDLSEYEELEELPDEAMERRGSRIQFNRRISITKFYKRKSPKSINSTRRRSSTNSNETTTIKPIIKTSSAMNIPQRKDEPEKELVSPTKYTIHVSKVVYVDKDPGTSRRKRRNTTTI